MVIVLLLIIIFLLAPWLLGVLGVVAVGAWGVISVGISIAAAIGLVFFVIAYLNHLRKATPEERKKELKILGIVLVVTASIVGIIASTISNTNNNHYLEMGKINLSYSVTEADEWFSKLPRSHNQEIIHVCMNMVENHKGFTSFYD
ncbi:MAG: hypothetical protein IJO67_00985, partial [Clostridia bacterium]|nr:hypothetical protein [Clostridia bacterium]